MEFGCSGAMAFHVLGGTWIPVDCPLHPKAPGANRARGPSRPILHLWRHRHLKAGPCTTSPWRARPGEPAAILGKFHPQGMKRQIKIRCNSPVLSDMVGQGGALEPGGLDLSPELAPSQLCHLPWVLQPPCGFVASFVKWGKSVRSWQGLSNWMTSLM